MLVWDQCINNIISINQIGYGVMVMMGSCQQNGNDYNYNENYNENGVFHEEDS